MPEIEFKLPEEELDKAIDRVIAKRHLVPESTLKARTIGMNEFRKKYCGNKGPDWVRVFIIDKFKVDWARDVHPGRGGHTIIFLYPAIQWLAKHRKDIDWEARL